MKPGLPIQAELVDILLIHPVSPAVADGSGMAVRPALGIEIVYDLSGTAIFAENINV